MLPSSLSLQFITHATADYSCIDSAEMALRGGCRWVQLRMKEADESLLERTAVEVQQMCRAYGATFIIDDNVLLAKRLKADGVHLGRHDMPIAEARRILGRDFIIGGTVNTLDDVVELAQTTPPDYFGCGPFRYTTTKKNLSPILGLEGYRKLLEGMRERQIRIPLVAIGGITRADIPPLLATGVSGIALSGGVLKAEDPIAEMRAIAALIRTR